MVVANGNARSIRMIAATDEIGFSLSDVRLKASAAAELWYKHHWEANFIISGSGKVENLNTGETWKLEPETLYCVGPKDRHRLSAVTDLHLLSVFCPPLAWQRISRCRWRPGGEWPRAPGAGRLAAHAYRLETNRQLPLEAPMWFGSSPDCRPAQVSRVGHEQPIGRCRHGAPFTLYVVGVWLNRIGTG